MEKKKTLNSHQELFKLRLSQYENMICHEKLAKTELEKTINNIALELGVPENELGQWAISKDLSHMKKVGQKKVHRGMKTVKIKKTTK